MKISIVTACYNSLDTLPETLKSVAKQSYSNIEHIVVEGQSTDGTLALLEDLNSPIKWVSEKDNGIYSASNKGIQLATGDIIGILNSDDQFYDDSINNMQATLYHSLLNNR